MTAIGVISTMISGMAKEAAVSNVLAGSASSASLQKS
jgi:hypothetical protein